MIEYWGPYVLTALVVVGILYCLIFDRSPEGGSDEDVEAAADRSRAFDVCDVIDCDWGVDSYRPNTRPE